jgi:type I restriction enzyme S subunit
VTYSLNLFARDSDSPYAAIGSVFTVTLGKMLDAGRVADPQASPLPYVRAANIQDTGLDLNDVNTMPFTAIEAATLDLRRNDILVVEGGAVGTCVVLQEDLPGWSFQKTVNRLRPTSDWSSRFIAYVLRAHRDAGVIDIVCNKSTIPHLTAEKLRALRVPAFAPRHQEAIADYLDRETARIDTLIEEQQRLIEMLRERRRALVTRTVCFGTDEGVELRDSGDPMLGLVPAHWTVKAVRRWLESLDGQRIPLSGEERADRQGNFDYYGASGVIDHVDDYLFDESLVLVSEDGANLLMRSTPIAFAAKGRYWVNNHAHVLRPLGGGDVDFWAQRLEALDVTTVVSGAAQPKLTAGALMGLRVAAPGDTDEQRHIAAYLNEQTSKLDSLIFESERLIELSRERRSALITTVVTGQVDVREAA